MIGHISYSKHICSLPTPHTKFCFNKNIPNYNRFHVNCYMKATCNILYCVHRISDIIDLQSLVFLSQKKGDLSCGFSSSIVLFDLKQ